MLVINFDYSCAMHAVQIPSCSRVRRSIELLHGDCRKPVCARQASWYLVVQVHNALAKKKKKVVQEAKGVYYLVTFEPLCKSLSSCTCLLTLFARPVHTLHSRHTLYLYSPINSTVAFPYNTQWMFSRNALESELSIQVICPQRDRNHWCPFSVLLSCNRS